MAKKDFSLETFLALLLIAFIMAPLFALVGGKIAGELWHRLLEQQYGAGPTMRSWYGISMIVQLLMFKVSKASKPDDQGYITWAVAVIIAWIINALMLLLVAVFACALLGWN